jgi:hypothetical protein
MSRPTAPGALAPPAAAPPPPAGAAPRGRAGGGLLKSSCMYCAGCWVVQPSFVVESFKQKHFVCEAEHEWRIGCATEPLYASNLHLPAFWRRHREQNGLVFARWRAVWLPGSTVDADEQLAILYQGKVSQLNFKLCALIMGGAELSDAPPSSSTTHVFSSTSCPGLASSPLHRCLHLRFVQVFLIQVLRDTVQLFLCIGGGIRSLSCCSSHALNSVLTLLESDTAAAGTGGQMHAPGVPVPPPAARGRLRPTHRAPCCRHPERASC